MIPSRWKELSVSWDGHKLSNHPHLFIGIILDRSFRNHLQNTKAKINTWNNILCKLVHFKWGTNPSTVRPTAHRSKPEPITSHKLVDTGLKDTCRFITGCTKTTPELCTPQPTNQTIRYCPNWEKSLTPDTLCGLRLIERHLRLFLTRKKIHFNPHWIPLESQTRKRRIISPWMVFLSHYSMEMKDKTESSSSSATYEN